MFLKKLDASFITLLTLHGIFPAGVERYKLYHPPRPSQHNYFLWVSSIFLKKLGISFITFFTLHGIFPVGVLP